MFGIEIPKQRGIYSEILTTEDTENLKVSHHARVHPQCIEANFPFLFIGGINLWTKQGQPLHG